MCIALIPTATLRWTASPDLAFRMGKRSRVTAGGGSKKAKASAEGAGAVQKAPSKPPVAAPMDIEDCGFEEAVLPDLRTALLSWYDANHRILPWRRNPHSLLTAKAVAAAAAVGHLPAPADLPQDRFIYYVWVCEIMSQQTQVARAAEYFRRWVERWPDVTALAAATQDEVNELWAGLGYYRRARFLLDGAKYIAGELGGRFPRTALELQKIPGVGAYTSAAIASIACGERAAVVDGNVIRVLARLLRLGRDPRSTAMTKLFADVAASALDPDRPGDFNQAVMELGATVCVPNTHPACDACPVNTWCAAWQAERQHGSSGDTAAGAPPRVTDYPTKVEKAEKREETVAVAVVRLLRPGPKLSGEGQFLLVKRPPGGLLAGLWEFPLVAVEGGASKEEARARMASYVEELLGVTLLDGGADCADTSSAAAGSAGDASAGVRVVERKFLGEVVHVFSHIRMTMRVEEISLQGGIEAAGSGGGGIDGESSQPAGSDDLAATAGAIGVGAAPPKVTKSRGKAASAPAASDARAETQWLSAEEVATKGLSSGVKKVYKLYTRDKEKALGGIKRFFKSAAGVGFGSK